MTVQDYISAMTKMIKTMHLKDDFEFRIKTYTSGNYLIIIKVDMYKLIADGKYFKTYKTFDEIKDTISRYLGIESSSINIKVDYYNYKKSDKALAYFTDYALSLIDEECRDKGLLYIMWNANVNFLMINSTEDYCECFDRDEMFKKIKDKIIETTKNKELKFANYLCWA